MVKYAGTAREAAERASMDRGNQCRTSVQSQPPCACDVEFRRIFAVAEAGAPDRVQFARHQPAFSEREAKIPQLSLHEAQPLSGAFLGIHVFNHQPIDFRGERIRDDAALVERREETSDVVPTLKFAELKRGYQNKPRRGQFVGFSPLLPDPLPAPILDISLHPNFGPPQ